MALLMVICFCVLWSICHEFVINLPNFLRGYLMIAVLYSLLNFN